MRGGPKKNRRDERARTDRAHQHCGRFAAADVHEENSADRAEHRDAAKHERINDRGRCVGERERANQNRADQTDGVRFENVSGHSGAIANVVAHVVRDRGRIARIIFLEIALDLADEIRADVGGLGVDSAAKSRENADQTRTECQPDKAAHRQIVAQHFARDRVENSDGEQCQPNNQQAGDRTSVKSHAQRCRRDSVAAWVVRTFARTAIRIPM